MIFKQQHMLRTALLAIPLCLIVAAVGMTQDKTEGDESGESQNTPQQKTENDAEFNNFGGGFGDSFAPGGTGVFAGGSAAVAGGMLTNERLIQGTHIMISWSKDNDELRGFSQKTGEWTNLKIEKQEKLVPTVNTDVAAVRVGDTMAAYSGTTGTWDVLKLSKDSDAEATLYGNYVKTTDNNYLYTFAASKGKWTSPNDPNFRRKGTRPSGNIAGFGSAYSGAKDGGGYGGGDYGRPLSSTVSGLNGHDMVIIQRYRGKGLDNDEAREALTRVVGKAFAIRLKQQKTEAMRLEEKLKKIQEAIEKRKSLGTKIIERRVDELLDPNIEWDKAFPGGTSLSYPIPGSAPSTPGSSR